MKAPTLFILFLLIAMTSCKQYYTIAGFEEKTIDHQAIAILPFQMNFSGIRPRDLTPEDIEAIEEAESRAFQASFYDAILASTRRGRNQLRVDIQHFSKTLSLLNENKISIRESWFEDPSKLAEILDVDAVVMARIDKTRYMSDLASYGIEVGTQVINVLSRGRILPGVNNRNKDVKTNYSLVDKNSGNTLWSIGFDYNADWRSRSEDMVDAINQQSARRFPYRIR